MTAKNYWDPNSGDSLASPWTSPTTASGMASSGTSVMQYGQKQADTTNPWMNQNGSITGEQVPQYGISYQDQDGWHGAGSSLANIWGEGTPTSLSGLPGSRTKSLSQTMGIPSNNDISHEDARYGAETTEGAHWSGGRPGAGTWVEAPAAAAVAAPPPPPTVPSAQAQTPAQTAPVADGPYAGPQDQEHFDWQAYAAYNPDVISSGYGVGTYSNPWDQMWSHWNQANSLGDKRAYVGYTGGRVDPRTTGYNPTQVATGHNLATNPWITSNAGRR